MPREIHNKSRKLRRVMRRFRRAAGWRINRNYTRTTARVGQVTPGVKTPKSLVDIQKYAELRAKNKPARLKLRGRLRWLARKKRQRERSERRMAYRTGRSPYVYSASRLQTAGGEYVTATGDDYKGYYHIHDSEVICTDAIHIRKRSQPLIQKELYLEHKVVYDRLAYNLGLEHKKLWLAKIDHIKKRRIARKARVGRTIRRTRPGGY